jgi:hypothetical protein
LALRGSKIQLHALPTNTWYALDKGLSASQIESGRNGEETGLSVLTIEKPGHQAHSQSLTELLLLILETSIMAVIVIRPDECDDGDYDDIELFDSSNFFQITFKCSSEQYALRHQYKVYYYFFYSVDVLTSNISFIRVPKTEKCDFIASTGTHKSANSRRGHMT